MVSPLVTNGSSRMSWIMLQLLSDAGIYVWHLAALDSASPPYRIVSRQTAISWGDSERSPGTNPVCVLWALKGPGARVVALGRPRVQVGSDAVLDCHYPAVGRRREACANEVESAHKLD